MPELAAHLERVAKEQADEIRCAVRNAAAEVFGQSVVTAGGWPETKQRMALIESFTQKVTERLVAALAACAREEAKWWERMFVSNGFHKNGECSSETPCYRHKRLGAVGEKGQA